MQQEEEPAVKLSEEGLLPRVYVGESDRWHDRPLYEAIVLRSREMGLAGATVLRGLAGFGASSRIHTAKLLRLSEDLPVVVEIADEAERIERFVPGPGRDDHRGTGDPGRRFGSSCTVTSPGPPRAEPHRVRPTTTPRVSAANPATRSPRGLSAPRPIARPPAAGMSRRVPQ